MKPIIESKKMGRISINNQQIDCDIFINIEGLVVKREPGLKREIDYLELTLAEANELYDPGANEMIIGSGEESELRLSNEATDFFEEKKFTSKRNLTNSCKQNRNLANKK